ncbi:MAG: type II toxin-antitoxin system RelE/ParE family toxin [Ghiorsea sp.]
MIQSFADKRTSQLFEGKCHACFQAFRAQAERKLLMLSAAMDIQDLRSPPANRLEKLAGDRAGYWSIRINKQWRVCFRFENGNAMEVEIVDYH